MDFVNHLKKYLNEKEIEKLITSFNEKSKHALLLNTNKMDEKTFLSYFPNITPHPFVKNGFYYDKDEYDLGKHIFHEMGVYYLQEPSAMIVSSLIDFKENDIVLDMCAAPGGKSVQAALKLNNTGAIISNDLSRQRCSILLNNIERMGISNVVITNNDFSSIYQNYINYFDKIILDAPCSGSGMFRKDDKMLLDWTYEKVLKNSAIQKQLIDIAFSMLKEGGLLVYSTCSYSYEEDEEVIQFLLNKYDNANIVQINKDDRFYVDKSNLGIHLFPSIFNGEGHYICLISKGQFTSNNIPIKENKRTIETIKKGHIEKYGDTTFALPLKVKTKGLNIVRYGVKVATIKGKDELYSYHLSHCIDKFSHACDIKESLLGAYIHGESISNELKLKNGITLLTYKNIPFSFGKIVNSTIKNHYPNYLRTKKLNF